MIDCRTHHYGDDRVDAQREDGIWAWAPDTAHEPVGIIISIGMRTKAGKQSEQRAQEPEYRKLHGNTESAKEFRTKYRERISKMFSDEKIGGGMN